MSIGDPYYAFEKFSLAVLELAIGKGDVRSRLYDAWLQFHTVSTNDLPIELREELNWINSMLTRCEASYPGESKVLATLRGMRNSTGQKIAYKIVSMTDKLNAYLRDERDRCGGTSSNKAVKKS
jgi:hypothetical protein